MNRLARRLLNSPQSRLLMCHPHPLAATAPFPPAVKTLNPVLPGALFRPFASQIESNSAFASLKCYTCREPETPYYVMESPPPAGELRRTQGKGRIFLPENLRSEQVEHLVCDTQGVENGPCDVYLVGVGRDEKSVQEVKAIVSYLKPEVVFLELCAFRRDFLSLEKLQGSKGIQVRHNASRVAFEEAINNGAKVILGDRPFDITVRRILESMLAMRIWEFIRLSFYLLLRFMEYGKDNKLFNINEFIRQKLEELKEFPTLLQPAIHERDLYMSSVLRKLVRDHSLVVAVVGGDHMAGIKKHLEKTLDGVMPHSENSG